MAVVPLAGRDGCTRIWRSAWRLGVQTVLAHRRPQSASLPGPAPQGLGHPCSPADSWRVHSLGDRSAGVPGSSQQQQQPPAQLAHEDSRSAPDRLSSYAGGERGSSQDLLQHRPGKVLGREGGSTGSTGGGAPLEHGGGGTGCCCDNSSAPGPVFSSGGHAGGAPLEPLQPATASRGQQQNTMAQPNKQAQQQAISSQQRPGRGMFMLLGSIAAVVCAGVANRVLYKMAITPLRNYVFFMAQLQTFGYCAVYFSVLAARRRSGRVSPDMMSVPASYVGLFTKIGLAEAVASLLGFLGAANLPGVVLPLLSQTGLVWQVLLARFMLGKQLGSTQVAGVGTVLAGVVLAAWPAKGAGSVLGNVHPGYAGLFVFSMLFPALSCIYKERVFREVREQQGRDLDLFIVNSYGSLAQAIFVFALLPVMTAMRGMAVSELPDYVCRGFQCLRGLTPACGSDCSGAPFLPLAYVATNLVFNIAALSLIRVAGNVVMSLVMSCLVPLTIWAFTVDLPFLPPAPPVGSTFQAGAALLVAGLLAYNAPLWAPPLRKKLQQWLAGNGEAGISRIVN